MSLVDCIVMYLEIKLERKMSFFRYINRLVAAVIMFIPFFVIMVPLFFWLDWAFEDDEDSHTTSDIIKDYWKLFKWKKNVK